MPVAAVGTRPFARSVEAQGGRAVPLEDIQLLDTWIALSRPE
jgi:hypothetical protein